MLYLQQSARKGNVVDQGVQVATQAIPQADVLRDVVWGLLLCVQVRAAPRR